MAGARTGKAFSIRSLVLYSLELRERADIYNFGVLVSGYGVACTCIVVVVVFVVVSASTAALFQWVGLDGTVDSYPGNEGSLFH